MPAVAVEEVEKSVEGSRQSAKESKEQHYVSHELSLKQIKTYMAGSTGDARSVWKNMLREKLTKRPGFCSRKK